MRKKNDLADLRDALPTAVNDDLFWTCPKRCMPGTKAHQVSSTVLTSALIYMSKNHGKRRLCAECWLAGQPVSGQRELLLHSIHISVNNKVLLVEEAFGVLVLLDGGTVLQEPYWRPHWWRSVMLGL